jgi:membrane-associated protein
MEVISHIIDLFLHLDKHLAWLVETFGIWTYVVLFLVIFCETGLVVTPFLPGDSLLFAIGALAATTGSLNIMLLYILLLIAAIAGDTVNYWIGHKLGENLINSKRRLIRKEHLDKTHQFYERHGGKTIIIARFIPIVRTFAPFVAGLGSMNYREFIMYNVAGAILWITSLLFAGYFFGTLPIVKNNFSLVVFAIIFLSLLPAVVEIVRQKFFPPKQA